MKKLNKQRAKKKTKQAIKNLWWSKGGLGEAPNKRAVIRNNGEEKEYKSISEAAKDVGGLSSSICNCLAGLTRASAGYKWRRV